MPVRVLPSVADYGSWRSPISAELVAEGQLWLTDVQLDGDDILWVEGRAADDGRYAVVRCSPDRTISDATKPGTNARSRVHEYGGAAYLAANGSVWYSDFHDGRLYEAAGAAARSARPITPPGDWRYAGPVLDQVRRRLICIREDHTSATLAAHGEPVNALVAVSLDSGTVDLLADDHDFCAAPAISPRMTHLAWLAWNHPNMPWDETELWVGEFGPDGGLVGSRRVAGGTGESVAQPRWSPDGVLHFISDRSGWWNLYRLADPGPKSQAEALAPIEADFAEPDWHLGLSTYGFKPDGSILAIARADGRDRLVSIDARPQAVEPLDLPFIAISYLKVGPRRAVFIAGSPAGSEAIVGMDLASGALETLRGHPPVDPAWTSVAEPITYATAGGRTAHAFYYAPRNPDFVAPAGTLPPLIVHVHGGPTSAASSALNGSIQYFTSRGLALLDVDYGGSSGYGRAYRELLRGQWGVVDVDDCIAGARSIFERGQADPERVVITGASAGGYTSLAALAFRDSFRAGVSSYGITDPATWEGSTHKFESRYTEGLIEPHHYRDRSPLHSADRIGRPVLILQGLDDRVVPPEQAEQMTAALRENGVPCAYLAFEGEGHDFRRSSSIRRALQAELSFFGQVLGFEPADSLEAVRVENPPSRRP